MYSSQKGELLVRSQELKGWRQLTITSTAIYHVLLLADHSCMYTVTGEKLSVKSSTHKGIWSDSWAIKLGLKAKRSSPKLLLAIQRPVGYLLACSWLIVFQESCSSLFSKNYYWRKLDSWKHSYNIICWQWVSFCNIIVRIKLIEIIKFCSF